MKDPDAASGSGPKSYPGASERWDGDGAELSGAQPSTPIPRRPSGRKRFTRTTRIGLTVIAIVTLLEAGAFAGNYFVNTSHYVSTDNAQVDGDKVDINAPITGTLTRWTVSQGSLVTQHQIVGRIQLQGSGAQPQRAIMSPGHGTIAVNHAVDGQYVTAGTELATAYDLNSIYVTARVDETDIRDVHVGQQVDISVDAFPDVPFTGLVENVQSSSAGVFSFFPGPDTDPTNPQKVTQYIPVKCEFTNTGGVALAPGMNVTVHIHKY